MFRLKYLRRMVLFGNTLSALTFTEVKCMHNRTCLGGLQLRKL